MGNAQYLTSAVCTLMGIWERKGGGGSRTHRAARYASRWVKGGSV